MNVDAVKTLLALELRSLVRDRRTVVLSIVLPIVTMPILLFASSSIEKRRLERLKEQNFTFALSGDEVEKIRQVLVGPYVPPQGQDASTIRPILLTERVLPDANQALNEARVDAWVEVVRGDRAREIAESEKKANRADSESEVPAQSESGATPTLDVAVVVHYRSDSSASQTASEGIRTKLEAYRVRTRDDFLSSRGLPVSSQIGVVGVEAISSLRHAAGLRVARFLSLLVVFFLTVAGATVAADIVAGEKERGTLETLLTTAASRREIVTAKLLAILTVGIVIVTLEFASVVVYSLLSVVDIPRDYVEIVTPETAITLLVMYLPVAAFVAGVQLVASGSAKSYKEAQLYLFPMQLVFAVLCAAPMLPGLTLRSAIVVVPIANISIAVKEILVGRYDWPMLVVAWMSMAGAAAFAALKATQLLSSESLVAGGESADAEVVGGPRLFAKRVLRWFGLMWVAVFVASGFLPTSDIRVQVAFNLLAVFFLSSMAMIRLYKLEPRSVLALRWPKPLVWLAVIIGAPSGLLVGLGVAQLANLVVPVPVKALQEFAKAFSASDIPLWQMLLFVALLPGIFEEIAFRGVLLHGLRRRFRPPMLCLVVGLIFGLFHFTLFRLASTAFLGVVLSAVVLMTGSIFPAMLWHFLNNGIAIAGSSLFPEDFAPPTWLQAAAVVPLALSLWILWKNRTPYPDLRT